MPDVELTYFRLLKEDIATQLRLAFPEVSADIREWKGQEIRQFQEELVKNVNGRISEKWFYTHIKTEQDHVPRIDILNLLSKYVGFESWADYKVNKIPEKAAKPDMPVNKKKYILGAASLICLFLILAFYITSNQAAAYQFCFINVYNKMPVQNANLDVIILHKGESPYRAEINAEGCLNIHTREDSIRFVVRCPYYQTDTISRLLDKGSHEEQIALKTDDYALMIRIFSTSRVDDWQKRRTQLDSMFTDNARIYQIFDKEQIGMEMYNKEEFINKLTMPIRSLRHIEVLETLYQSGKIKEMRFKQVNPEAHE